MSVYNAVVDSVVGLINTLDLFAQMTRGALTTTNSLVCEIAPSNTQEVYLDKNSLISLTLAINGKHANLQTLTDDLGKILDNLSRRKEYPTGNGFEIVDITIGNFPRTIGREENSDWIAACDLIVKFYRKDDETD